ncbi:hypothetical protein GCM10009560_32540 [Nonomuraea longicatena]|uniref:Septum formation initiator n=1 Tax=Nonomuraea longicatena TaxID=83682 RepID=A0ABN1PK64_9ACTN
MGESGPVKRLVIAWLVVALAATGAAVAVLGLLGGSITGGNGHVMTQAEARAQLATVPAGGGPARAQTVTPTVRPGGTGAPAVQSVIRTAGGTVIASCSGGQVSLRNWSPYQGFSADDQAPGPADRLTVEFDRDDGADNGEDVEVVVGCSAGQPVTLAG